MTAEEFKNSVIPFSRKLYPMLMRILKDEEETKDALQDLMVKLWNKRAELDKCQNRDAYIYMVAKNYSFDLLKKKRPVMLGEKEKHKMLNIEAPEMNPDSIEKYEYVRKVIEQLPKNYQTVIQLRDIEGQTFEEISSLMGLEVTNIRVILSRARQKVKMEVEKIYRYENKEQLTGEIL